MKAEFEMNEGIEEHVFEAHFFFIYTDVFKIEVTIEIYFGSCQTTLLEFLCKSQERLKILNYFCKKLHLRCLIGPKFSSE